MATFQEELKSQLAQFVPEDKRAEFEEQSAGIFTNMGSFFEKQANDMKAIKAQLDEAKRAASVAANGGELKIDPHEYEEVKKALSERESAFDELNRKYAEESQKRGKHEKTAEQLKAKLDMESNAYSKLVKEYELNKAMNLLSLTEGTRDEVFDLLSKNVQVKVDEQGNRKVVAVVLGEDGKPAEKPLDFYVTDWAQSSPLAKRVLAVARNSGGGATGGAGSVGGPATLQQQYDAAAAKGNVAMMMSLKARMAAGEA